MSRRTVRIATRASNLALWQANFVAERLRSVDPDLHVELVHVATTGDRVGGSLTSGLGIGVFTREIQRALLDRRADVAVHSLKDLPTEPVDEIVLAAVPERASPWDALAVPKGSPSAAIADLPARARIGTGSRRRRAQILRLRPDLQMLDVRGNVETRLKKLDDGSYDALILAEAGLERLGLSERIVARLTPPALFPAAGQGALGVECRCDDRLTRTLLDRINDQAAFAATAAERCILARLHAGCHAPVGVATTLVGERLDLEAVVLSADGKECLLSQASGSLTDPVALGTVVADDLLRQGAGPLIEAAKAP